MIVIRKEYPLDCAAIHAVNGRAFGRSDEANLVDELRNENATILSLVALSGDVVVGHALYSPVTVTNGTEIITGAGLGPVAVLPEYQRRGIGAKLIESGNQLIGELAIPFVVVLGDPKYYCRFGFEPAQPHGLRCRWEVPEGAFMVLGLNPITTAAARGLVRYHRAFDHLA